MSAAANEILVSTRLIVSFSFSTTTYGKSPTAFPAAATKVGVQAFAVLLTLRL
jgi:hypothetical protein